MKITLGQLRRIIKEEVAQGMRLGDSPCSLPFHVQKQQLLDAINQSMDVYELRNAVDTWRQKFNC